MKIRRGASGTHLFDRTSGLNVLLDHSIPDPGTWDHAPRHIAIALTNACDLSCDFCFAPKSRSALSLSKVEEWLVELDRNGTLGVGYGGGEPTLHPQFADLCRFTMEQTGLAVSFTTHGHHIDKALTGELKGHVNFIRVSMDGLNEVYERHRGRSFEEFIRRLPLIAEIAPFGINFVVNSQTFAQLDAAIELTARFGATDFLLLPQQTTRSVQGIDEQTLNGLRSWAAAYRGPVSLAVSELGSEGLPTCDPFINEDPLTRFAHIDAAGNIKRCGFDSASVPIGSSNVLAAINRLRHPEEKHESVA